MANKRFVDSMSIKEISISKGVTWHHNRGSNSTIILRMAMASSPASRHGRLSFAARLSRWTSADVGTRNGPDVPSRAFESLTNTNLDGEVSTRNAKA